MAYSGYSAYLSVNQTSVRDKNIVHTKRLIQSDFMNSPNYYQVPTYTPSTPLSSTPLDLWVLDDSETKDQKNIIAMPSLPLEMGYLHYWQNNYWLTFITDKKLGDIYSRGTAIRCYSSIKWLDDDGIVREAWFFMKFDSPSNFGVEDGKVLIMPNERRTITIQNNEYTRKINKERRFIIDGRAWRTIGVDRLIDGLITLTLEENQINVATDNPELGIADYYNNLHVKTISILNGATIELNIGNTLQLNVQTMDNGTVVSEDVVYTSSDASIATVDENGLITSVNSGNVVITATLASDNTVTDSITVQVDPVVVNNYLINISGSDECKIGQFQTYTAEIRNNGVVDSTKIVAWSLLADDQIGATTLANITSQNETSCTIKANSNQQYGYVQLKATMVGDSSIVAYKRIKIRSLL